jgi:hypothetical protein
MQTSQKHLIENILKLEIFFSNSRNLAALKKTLSICELPKASETLLCKINF